MKGFVTGLLFFWVTALWGQITYSPVFIEPCSMEEQLILWSLRDSLGQIYSFEEGADFKELEVPELGNYQLYSFLRFSIPVFIAQKGINRDTFFMEKLHWATYMHPISYMHYCDSLANGEITTYYYNGQIRKRGTFKEGQMVDSFFCYHRNGTLAQLHIPHQDSSQDFTYYENGQIKKIVDRKNNIYQAFYPTGQLQYVKDTKATKRNYYYPDGQLKKSVFHKSKKAFQQTTYYPDGQVKRSSNYRGSKHYNPQGVLVQMVREKKVFLSPKVFTKKEASNSIYECQWKSYDSTGTLQRKIAFFHDFLDPIDQVSLQEVQQIKPYQFEEVLFYEQGQAVRKIVATYTFVEEELVQQFQLYQKQDKDWTLMKVFPLEKIYNFL